MSYLEQNMRSIALGHVEARATKFISDVYVRMTIALFASAAIGYLSVSSGLLLWGFETLGNGFSMAIFISQILTVVLFQASVFKMKSSTAQLLFAIYAAITGLTLGMVGLLYTLDSIFTIGLASGAGFAALVTYGKLTRRDLGPLGTFCIMALTMLMVYSLGVWAVGYFLPNAALLASTIKIQGIFGCLCFSGLTAYEAQRLKKVAYGLAESQPTDAQVESFVNAGALNMFMNFIGLFLSAMRLFGSRR